jgi:RsiW-degrading membrane proteinase PrsW (M82 family)
MDYIENIYVCLMAPLLITAICLRGGGQRMIIFLLGGMTVCLLSSYISTFMAVVNGADQLTASLEISPFVEEIMKFLPVLFYLLVFEPRKRQISEAALLVAVGFATFENVCYLTQNGASHIMQLLIRGFGTGAMHVVCGMIVAFGLLYLWNRIWIRIAGTIGLLAVGMTYHGIYNILVSQPGAVAIIGYFIPMLTIALFFIFRKKQNE